VADAREPEAADLDAVVVGAGMSGLYAVYRLRRLGLRVRGIEAGDGVGGTWYWNRYPGCRCDVPTIEYSYSFDAELEQEWTFPETMSTQPEIERYLNHVADRFSLRSDFRFGTRVTAATFDEAAGRWIVETNLGDRYAVRWCVMATGSLSAPNLPAISGIDSFAGSIVHTGLWPREGVELGGKRVGVIGTGSSGTQAIPKIAEVAAELTVFQRTPNYAFPARVEATDPDFERYVKASYCELRRLQRSSRFGISGFTGPAADGNGERQAVGAGAFARLGVLSNPAINQQMQDAFARMVRTRVRDQAIADALIPTDYPMGCKRPVVEVGYYETFNQENVTLVDLRQGGITEITATGVRTEQGDYQCDVLVFATGFDALTGPLTRIDVRGRDGQSLREKWASGPRAYIGLVTAGFPNLFLITGPGSPSVLSNMVVSIEQHVEWVAEAIDHMRSNGIAVMDADPKAEDDWVEHVQDVAQGTPWTAPSCNSWYLGANIEGKARVFMPYVGGVAQYRATCAAVVEDGYRGFVLTP
jgi:cation diffusion facilitator CzcD-associated flavoprotein CzcO